MFKTIKFLSFLIFLSQLFFGCKKNEDQSLPLRIEFVNPLDSGVILQNQRVMIRAMAEIDSPDEITEYQLYIDGQLFGTDTDFVGVWQWTTLNASIGSHKLEVKASSTLGRSGSKTISVTVAENALRFNPELSYGSMQDKDGNTYKTITIGKQTWMAEDLRTTRYNNGEKISDYKSLSQGPIYLALLYSWNMVTDPRRLAPAGWHIPSNEEWVILINSIGGWNAVSKLKESGYLHWIPGLEGSNSSGFSAIPFTSDGNLVVYWTATPSIAYSSKAFAFYIEGMSANLRDNPEKTTGLLVRCLKD